VATNPPPMTKPALVVGAGIAGLVAARELRRAGREVIVFEAGPRVAGLATSHHDDDGFSYDTGAHFITNRLAAEIGVEDRCRTVHRYGEAVWSRGKTYSYPFGLVRVPRFAADAVRSKLRSGGPAASARDWFVAEYGRALAEEVAIPLVEAWSGAPASELSPAIGDKIPSSILETIYLRLAARVTRKAVAVGYCNEAPQSRHVWHVYPEDGVATLCDHLAAGLGDAVRLNSPVEKILVEGGRARGVRIGGEEVEGSLVVSTAPVNVLPRIVEGTGVEPLDRFRPFRFRPMVFVNLRLRGRGLLPDVVTWTPSDTLPFFRLTEAPMAMPWLAPEGKTLLTVDIGAEVGDEHWTMDDDQLGERCLDHLEAFLPGVRAAYLGCRVVRTPIAYPVFLNEYEPAREALETSTGITDLLSVGRNGQFGHLLMEDVYWRTTRAVARWLAAAPS
jgi:oxygen-dependent protoporphyrinogen oxidase